MNVSIDDINNSLKLSSLKDVESILLLPFQVVHLRHSKVLDLPNECNVTPFIFRAEKKFLGGFVIDFILENIVKQVEPYLVEEEISKTISRIKTIVGFENAKLINPIEGSSQEVEGLPCVQGDCFIFEL